MPVAYWIDANLTVVIRYLSERTPYQVYRTNRTKADIASEWWILSAMSETRANLYGCVKQVQPEKLVYPVH